MDVLDAPTTPKHRAIVFRPLLLTWVGLLINARTLRRAVGRMPLSACACVLVSYMQVSVAQYGVLVRGSRQDALRCLGVCGYPTRASLMVAGERREVPNQNREPRAHSFRFQLFC